MLRSQQTGKKNQIFLKTATTAIIKMINKIKTALQKHKIKGEKSGGLEKFSFVIRAS